MAIDPFTWTCPHCQRPQVVNYQNHFTQNVPIQNPPASDLGDVGVRITSITCQNPDCRKLTLSFDLFQKLEVRNGWQVGEDLANWRLIPESIAKPQPDFIPRAIVADYTEACRIRELSPKASATLARRCLQGMIRDFCQIKKARLVDEIKELRTQIDEGRAPRGVTHESVDAILRRARRS